MVLKESAYVSRQTMIQSGPHPRLSTLDIELTERCNNACRHCYINLPEHDREASARELSTAEWQDIFRQAAGLGALSLRITGGEPLLRPDFAQLYLFARKLGLKITLYTNARLVTPELAQLFARIPPLEPVEVTVYGMRPETYDAVACAPGAFAEFRCGIDLLLEHRVPFRVKTVVLPHNRAELTEFESWAAQLPGMRGQAPGYTLLLDLRGRHDSPTRSRHIRHLRWDPQDVLELRSRYLPRDRAEAAQFCRRFIGPPGAQLFDCGAGLGGSVDAYGRYQPCMLLRDPALSYDLRQGSLREGIEHFFPVVRRLQATNPDYLDRCARCFLHGLCEQCPAKSWIEHGTLDTPVEYLCQVTHAQARDLGLLEPGESAWEVTGWRARLARLPDPQEGEFA